MTHSYDLFGRVERPIFTLCNPNKEELYIMGHIQNTQLKLRYNALSEISFKVPFKLNNEEVPYYNLIRNKRLVKIESIGIFVITNVDETNDGIERSKTVNAHSLEYELSIKNISQFKGTYKLYDFNNADGTVIGEVMKYLPRWRIAHVDVEIAGLYRTFDIADQNIYNFLISDIEEAFECVFEFNTLEQTISIYTPQNAIKRTDIFLSYDNLLKKTKMEEKTDELVTALSVFGGGDLNIRKVNPLGTSYIYDFTYFKTTEWMSQSLINAITVWENKVKDNQTTYSNHLTSLRTKNRELITLQGELYTLQADYVALEGVQKVRIEAGQPYDDITSQMTAKQNEINAKQEQINVKKTEINNVNTALQNINKSLQFEQNFTTEQIKELSCYIIESTYQNDAFIETSIMTEVEIQDMAQQLFEQGKSVLANLAQPRFTFTTDTVNFLFIKEFKPYADQIRLGSEVTVDLDNEKFAYPILLEMSYSYDDPQKLELVYSNKLRMDSEDFRFAELFGEAIKTTTSVKFDSVKWGEWVDSGAKDEFIDFVNSALDASKNAVINAENQEIVINQNGLRGRQYIPSSKTYSPNQVWLTSRNLVFSDDGFQTAKTALGEVLMPDGSKSYGIVADAIIGKFILGNKLAISDAEGIVNISGNLIAIRNDKGVEKVRLGKYDVNKNKYGLQLLSTTGNVVLDEEGIMQTWQEGKCDNVADGKPLRLYIYVPSGTKHIRKASLRWKVDKFRAFSTATGGGGRTSTSTSSGGGMSTSTYSGGGTSSSTYSNATIRDTTDSSDRQYVTSDAEDWRSGGDVHNHGISVGTRLLTADNIAGHSYVQWVGSGQHTHSVTIPRHSHSFEVSSHRHDFNTPSHSHDFYIPDHSHSFTIDNHTHEIMYGIYESSTTPSGIKVFINGTQRGSTYSGDIDDFDISSYLAIGRWNTIELSSTRLGRIDATCFIQAFMSTD